MLTAQPALITGPFDWHEAQAPSPAGPHVAVRAGLYWAQGWMAGTGALDGAGGWLRAGAVVPDLAEGHVGGIGLSLAEPPGVGARLVAGDVLSLRLGRASAMLVVGAEGPEFLWRSSPG